MARKITSRTIKMKAAVLAVILLMPAFVFSTPVSDNGRLQVAGLQLSNECGNAVQLKGISSHGLQWYGVNQCLNYNTLQYMANTIGIDVFRAAMYVNENGYLTNPAGFTAQVNQLVDWCEQLGIYCIIDWHILNPGDPNASIAQARTFWENMANTHKNKKHVIYEICNEPNGVNWATVRNYANDIIPRIRAIDPDTVIIVGTPNWSQLGADVAANPLAYSNIMYAFHFYAASHNTNMVTPYINQIPIFCTEWGVSEASGTGAVNYGNATNFLNIFNGNTGGPKISWAGWSWSDKNETSAYLNPGTCGNVPPNLTGAGNYVVGKIQENPNNWTLCNPPTPTGTPTRTSTWNPAVPTYTPTVTPTPVPANLFDDFETGALDNGLVQYGNGSTLTYAISQADKYEGANSLQVDTTGAGWAMVKFDSPYDGGIGYKDLTGATYITFNIKAPAGTVFFIQLEESTLNGGEGERYSNRTATLTSTGAWQEVTLTLAGLTRDQYTPVMGDNVFDLQAIKSFIIQFQAPGTKTIYLDNVRFTGALSPTATATTQVQAPTPTATDAGGQACLIWSDEFDGPAIDTTKWVYDIGGWGWGNNELEYYTNRPENSRIENGELVIEARQENYGGMNYTSARLKTLGKFSHKYGRIEARIKLPYGQGIWPAFWMLGSNITTVNWPACGEIDIMEMVGGGENRDDTTYGTAHWDSGGGAHAYQGGNKELPDPQFFYQDYHVFSVEWDATTLKWYLDGTLFYTLNITPAAMSELHNDFFILLNLAVGGQWPGNPDGTTVFPQKMYVDWVRWYDCTAVPATSTPTATATATRTFSATATYTATATATGTSTASATCTRTVTQTQTATATSTATFTNTAVFTSTGTFTATSTATFSSTMTFTPAETASATDTPPPGSTETDTFTVTHTGTATRTPTSTSTLQPTSTATFVPTLTQTDTAVFTQTMTNTGTPVVVPTSTATFTATHSSTIMPSATHTATRTQTPVSTQTSTATAYVPPATGTPTSTLSAAVPTATSTGTPAAADEGGKPEFTGTPVVYPHPATGGKDVHLQFCLENGAENVKVEIYTVAFRKVECMTFSGGFVAGEGRVTVPKGFTGRLSAGTYYYMLTASRGAEKARSRIGKLVILK